MEFDYFEPATVNEACKILADYNGDAKILAGGTDLVVGFKLKEFQPRAVVNIKKISELNRIEKENGATRIGTLVTLTDIAECKEIHQILKDAAKKMASCPIRNIATIGGNLCNASPAADLAPPLLCLDTALHVHGTHSERTIKLIDFFKGPGKTCLANDEIVTDILIQNQFQRYRGEFVKFSYRKASDLAIVNLAVLADGLHDVRISLGAVAPTPIRVSNAEKFLQQANLPAPAIFDQAAKIAQAECSPITDQRASEWYRRELVHALIRRVLTQIFKK